MDVVLYNKSEYETKLKLKGIIKQFILSNFWYYVNPLLELSYYDNKHEINKIKFELYKITKKYFKMIKVNQNINKKF